MDITVPLCLGALLLIGVSLVVGFLISSFASGWTDGEEDEEEAGEAGSQEEGINMLRGKNGKVFEKLIDVAQKTLREAEQTKKELEDLPEIGDVPEFREVLAKSTKGLRRALDLPAGAEMQFQVVQWLSTTSEAMIKAEEIKLRASLAKEKAGQLAALGPIEVRYGLLSVVATLKEVEELQPKIGYDMEPFKLAAQNFSKRIVALQMHKQFAGQLGIDLPDGFMEPLTGLESLGPVEWDPSRTLGIVDDSWDDDDVPDADNREEHESDPDEDVVEGSFSDKDIGT